jgi:hypothetical protein
MEVHDKDPIFKNFKSSFNLLFVKPKLIGQSLKNGAKIETAWADGIDVNTIFLLPSSKTILITNNQFDCPVALEPFVHIVNPSYYGLMYCNYQVDAYTPVIRDFNCFMNRYDINRQSWLYHLVRRNYFYRGHISFNCEINNDRIPDKISKGLSPQEVFEYGFQHYNQIFSKEHEKIKNQIPLQTFEDTGNLTNPILTSKFSLVLETWFHDNRVQTFSEKTMRVLQLPRPWVLFSTQHAVKQLRRWGFDVLDDIVDHSYDDVSDPIQRQIKILDIMESMLDLDIESVAKRCIQASNHNQSILKLWHDVWEVNIAIDLEIARQKALAL